MDFLEDMELYGRAMDNAYSIITKRKTLDDIYYELEAEIIDDLPLPFDPIEEDGRTPDMIDIVIEYFIETEEYEKCAELVKIKEECLKIPTEPDKLQ
tara:strand:- start:9923 stop:10213 length:291 start_codon:yes stop_codon:yes gene_type:complete